MKYILNWGIPIWFFKFYIDDFQNRLGDSGGKQKGTIKK